MSFQYVQYASHILSVCVVKTFEILTITATDFSLKEVPEQQLSSVPRLLSAPEQPKLYFKKDTKFNVPKGQFYIEAYCASLVIWIEYLYGLSVTGYCIIQCEWEG